jgi:predicted lipase
MRIFVMCCGKSRPSGSGGQFELFEAEIRDQLMHTCIHMYMYACGRVGVGRVGV